MLFAFILAAALNPINHKISRASYEQQLSARLKCSGQLTETEKPGEEAFDRPDGAAIQEYYMTLDPALGHVPANRRIRAWIQSQEQQVHQPKSTNSLITWNIVPSNMGGRTRALLWDPNSSTGNKVWAASTTGGLWRNDNITIANSPWVPVSDVWPGLSISCITYDPLNTMTMYAGTGEAQTAINIYRESSGRGYGIWKTTDGGFSWNLLPSTQNFAYVTDIVIRKENNNSVLYAGVVSGKYMGADHQSMPSDGLYRSPDQGATWTQVLPNISGETKPWPVSDIALTADSARIIVGTMRNLDGKGGATLLYSDPGTAGTWTVNETYRLLIQANTQYYMPGRVVLAAAPSNPDIIYAAIAAGFNNGGFDAFHGMYVIKTSNKGISWTTKNIPPLPNNQVNWAYIAWHAMTLAVDPNNENTVWAGGLNLYRSTDACTSWTECTDWSLMYSGGGDTYVHGDQHCIAYKPGSSSTAMFGCDGGVYYSGNMETSGPSPVFGERNKNYSSLQFYSCDQSPINDQLIGGLQDNGSVWYTGNPFSLFDMVSGGDGAMCFFDKDIPTTFVTSIYNNIYVVFNTTAILNYIADFQSGIFINPADLDPKFNTIYANGSDMFGIHQDEILRIKNIDGTYLGEFIPLNTGSVVPYSHIKVSPHSTLTNIKLFIGTMAGRLFKVTNAQNTPVVTEIGSPNFPNGAISCVAVGPTDDTLLMTFSNYGVSSIWQTYNGGTTWKEVEGNLPDMPVRWAIYHPGNTNQAMIATESGVWNTSSLGNTNTYWAPCNNGLANVRVDMLQVRNSDNKVVAATHGRGLATGFYAVDPTTSAPAAALQNFNLYPNPTPGRLYVNGITSPNAQISIFSADGKLVLTKQIQSTGSNSEIDLSNFKKGEYLVKIQDGFRIMDTRKVIKY